MRSLLRSSRALALFAQQRSFSSIPRSGLLDYSDQRILTNVTTPEDAVNNILYNTPNITEVGAAPQRRVLSALVDNQPGVLVNVANTLSSRGFNIESLVVGATEIKELSRITMTLNQKKGSGVSQAIKQLEALVHVWAVLDYSDVNLIEREMLLLKVSLFPPGDPNHKLPEHTGLVAIDEEEVEGESEELSKSAEERAFGTRQGTDSDQLLRRHTHRQSIKNLAEIFGADVTDIGQEDCTISLTSKTTRLNNFIKLMRPFGIVECSRSGAMAIPRSRIIDESALDEEEEVDEVDASMLPPG